MGFGAAKKEDASDRRRKQAPKTEAKQPGSPAEIALARNVAELEARITQGRRTALALRITMGRLEAQKETLLKFARDMAETGAFDMAVFEEIRQRELEDAGVVEASAEEEADDEEL